MTGIKNLVEIEDLAVKVFKGIEKSKADGKWDVSDVLNFMDVALVIKPALEDLSLVPAELADLDEAELEQVIVKASEAFPELPPKAVQIAKGVFKILTGGIEVYKALKA